MHFVEILNVLDLTEELAATSQSRSVIESTATTTTAAAWARPTGRASARVAAVTSAVASGPPGYHRRGSLQVSQNQSE